MIVRACFLILFLCFMISSASGKSSIVFLNHYSDYGIPNHIHNATFGIQNNPFGYSDEYTDSETGLQYLHARYYNPELMRFTQMDTYPLLNRYAYANDNPIMDNDPSGHNPVSQAINIAGTGIGIIASSFDLVAALSLSDPLVMTAELLSTFLGVTSMISGTLGASDPHLTAENKEILGGYSLGTGILSLGFGVIGIKWNSMDDSEISIAQKMYNNAQSPDAKGNYGDVYIDKKNGVVLKLFQNQESAARDSARTSRLWNEYYSYMSQRFNAPELGEFASAESIKITGKKGENLFGMITPYISGNDSTLLDKLGGSVLSENNQEYLRAHGYIMSDSGIPSNFKMYQFNSGDIEQLIIDFDDIYRKNPDTDSIKSSRMWRSSPIGIRRMNSAVMNTYGTI